VRHEHTIAQRPLVHIVLLLFARCQPLWHTSMAASGAPPKVHMAMHLRRKRHCITMLISRSC